MTNEEVVKRRFAQMMNQDFEPTRTMGSAHITTESRMVAALEYSAYQLGKIRQLLEEQKK